MLFFSLLSINYNAMDFSVACVINAAAHSEGRESGLRTLSLMGLAQGMSFIQVD